MRPQKLGLELGPLWASRRAQTGCQIHLALGVSRAVRGLTLCHSEKILGDKGLPKANLAESEVGEATASSSQEVTLEKVLAQAGPWRSDV